MYEKKQKGKKGKPKIAGITFIPSDVPKERETFDLSSIDRGIIEGLFSLGGFTAQELKLKWYRPLLLGMNKWKRRGVEILTGYRGKYIGKKIEGMTDKDRRSYVFRTLKTELEKLGLWKEEPLEKKPVRQPGSALPQHVSLPSENVKNENCLTEQNQNKLSPGEQQEKEKERFRIFFWERSFEIFR